MKLYKYIPIHSIDENLFQSYFSNLKVSFPNELNDPFEGFFSRTDLKKRIGCLSKVAPAKDGDSIYMWSFYANALKGICIEYKYSPIVRHGLKYGDVLYSNKSGIDIFTKYSSWKAEKEYRFVMPFGDEKILPITDFGLEVTAIFLGVGLLAGHPPYIKERNRKMRELEIYQWIITNLKKIPVHVCVRNRKSYRINSKRLNTV